MYSIEEFLKAAEIGEVSMIDANHIVSLLAEARFALHQKTTMRCRCNYCEKQVDFSTGVFTCEDCSF